MLAIFERKVHTLVIASQIGKRRWTNKPNITLRTRSETIWVPWKSIPIEEMTALDKECQRKSCKKERRAKAMKSRVYRYKVLADWSFTYDLKDRSES